MKKTLITTLLTLALIFTAMPHAVYAASDPLNDKLTYYTEESDYIPGDCILTATRMMIRRAAIINGCKEWQEITNEALRPDATVDGCLLSSFSFKAEGLKYKVGYGEFEGEDDGARIAEFEKLLKKHPEGVVVHGDWAAEYGMHGVLLVDVKDGTPYAMDAAMNMGMFNEGIQKWSDTTMLEPCACTRYWYITEISGAVLGGDEEDNESNADGDTETSDAAAGTSGVSDILSRLLSKPYCNMLMSRITTV